MATLLFWPFHTFVQKWSKLCQGKNLVFGKSSVLSQYLLKRNKILKRKKLASERCTKTKFPELLIHLGGAPRMCFELQKHLPCVYKPWPKALQNPNFSWQHPEMFCKLETLHWRNSISNLTQTVCCVHNAKSSLCCENIRTLSPTVLCHFGTSRPPSLTRFSWNSLWKILAIYQCYATNPGAKKGLV